MDGEPYISDSGQFVMEVSAIASYIDGVSAWYDDKVGSFQNRNQTIKDCRQKIADSLFLIIIIIVILLLIFCGRL